ncbi:uncharacterized protein DUF4397 [Arcticibacter pallidicorallinus]|uniref:Uncharacterized protein DUF4397 n=1 Tax=Arcticibacter pallidicorallinus TaxID=1259464 RepID=A0A2T0U9X4_9SPHI|nr:DUF4397 domain-containing protein [Arcticibacter pallidicorallinus]PRY54668.1 uncharacterized protein DUF4397 [Arcticibacter pallidicorallinus]
MKKQNTLGKFLLFAAAGVTLGLSSCSDDDISTGESVNVKIVNAAESSSAQDVFIEDVKVNSSALGYLDYTGYITTTNSGNDRKIESRTSGSADIFATEKEDLKSNRNYTFFLTGTGSSADIEVTEDDLTAPASGKVKVRFVHVSSKSDVPEKVDIYSGNNKIAAGIERGDVSRFQQIDAGLKAIGVLTAGSTDLNAIKSLSIQNLDAGKIYTILIYGSTEVNARVISHN